MMMMIIIIIIIITTIIIISFMIIIISSSSTIMIMMEALYRVVLMYRETSLGGGHCDTLCSMRHLSGYYLILPLLL